MDVEEVATAIVDSAVKVHRALGPGLLESAYQTCLAYELRQRGFQVACEVVQPLWYDGVEMEIGFRLDMLVEDCILVENKAVDKLTNLHEAQLINYLRLRNGGIGFLINWNVERIKDGLHRLKV